MEHSPTPWKIEINDGDFDVMDANDQSVAIASRIYPECVIGIEKEDAEHIVDCVNKAPQQQALIDELVKGLENLKANILSPDSGDDYWICGEIEELLAKAKEKGVE